MNFNDAYKLVGIAEGGYSNDPKDKGGETICGIARKKNPSLSIWDDIDKWKSRGITGDALVKLAKADTHFMARVEAFYRGGFWSLCKCEDLPPLMRYPVFSCAVNCSPAAAAKFLQRALGVKDDGIIGVQTTKAARLAKCRPIIEDFCNRWRNYYERLVIADPTQKRFIKGWNNRIDAVMRDNF